MGSPLSPGTKLGRYEIRLQLGAGGMGEVYLGRDMKLDRDVALKILPADIAADRNRMSRFVQEAKTASALNHPNIFTIYEIGEAQGIHFIASEFIDGENLRQRMRDTHLKLTEVLNITMQTAEALATAHEAGIIHRDIKPENVMLRRRDGYVKVLDFGLAKLTEQQLAAVDTEAPTQAQLKTEPGVVMGTVIYMSPEQARGLAVDVRTDIWSLGVLLYEMVAGCLPFEGATRSEILASILNEKEPPPLARFARDVPAELERIVTKALRKEREERYQTIKDMALDLKNLKQELELQAKLERSGQPSARPIQTEKPAVSSDMRSAAQQLGRDLWSHKAVTMAIAFGAIVLLVGLAYFLKRPAEENKAIDSIAVLPLANASNDPNGQYLSDGITDSLIESLSQLPHLKVMSHNSVFRYKGDVVDVRDVATKLNVRAVLTGRMAQLGDYLIINVELVDAQDNSHLWGEQYNRKLSDLLAVQSEIAQEISRKLRTKLTGEEQRRVSKSYTDSAEAYQLYLKGRYYWHKFSEGDFKRALDYFQQAIDKDPNYALAYAGMADCYWQLGWYNYVPKKEAWPKARAAIEKALERDKTVAGAHTSLATYKDVVDRDLDGAEAEFKQAISLNSSAAQTHMQYSWHLDAIGQIDNAVEEARKAHELDPLSIVVTASLGQALFYGRRYDEAIEVYQQALQSDPNSDENHAYLGFAFEQKRMYDEAINEFVKARDLSDADFGIGGLGHAYAVSGKTSEARKLLDQLLTEAPVRGYAVALIYAGLGDKDSALVWLNKTFDDEDRRNQLIFLKVDPIFDTLRADQHFTDLLRRLNLPE